MPSITVHSVTLTRSALEALDGHGNRLTTHFISATLRWFFWPRCRVV